MILLSLPMFQFVPLELFVFEQSFQLSLVGEEQRQICGQYAVLQDAQHLFVVPVGQLSEYIMSLLKKKKNIILLCKSKIY